MTPKKLMAWLWFARRRQKRRDAHRLSLMWNASHGEQKAINKMIEKAEKD